MSNNKTLAWLRGHRVAVLKGGWSRERSISLKTGASVEAAFKRLKIPILSIDVKPTIMTVLQKKKIDFAFLALHGAFGEDGAIQSILDVMKILYTGCGPLASALAMDKNLSKILFAKAGVPTPQGVLIRKAEYKTSPVVFDRRIKTLLAGGPLFVKPYDQGSAIGARRVSKLTEWPAARKACFRISDGALIEKFFEGRELTVGILNGKVLPVVEIVPEHAFYDFHSKYTVGGSRHLVPAPIGSRLRVAAQRLALRAFRSLGCDVYGRVDLLLSKNGKLVVLEVNTIPGMTNTSLLPDAARFAGLGFDQLVLTICEASLNRRKI